MQQHDKCYIMLASNFITILLQVNNLIDYIDRIINIYAESKVIYHQLIFKHLGAHLLSDPNNFYGKDMLLNGRAPGHGDVIKLPLLAKTFKVDREFQMYLHSLL